MTRVNREFKENKRSKLNKKQKTNKRLGAVLTSSFKLRVEEESPVNCRQAGGF